MAVVASSTRKVCVPATDWSNETTNLPSRSVWNGLTSVQAPVASRRWMVPVRTSWRFNLPGAALTMLMWIFGSFLLRWVLVSTAQSSTTIYGPLSAPIVVMLWLYLLSIAVLICAAVNAAFDRIWPEKETARARMELVRRLRMTALMPRLRRDDDEQDRFPDVAETIELQLRDEGVEPVGERPSRRRT